MIIIFYFSRPACNWQEVFYWDLILSLVNLPYLFTDINIIHYSIAVTCCKDFPYQNYAIIDKLEIDFSGKLNIITGETGAGKSIIVGALGLILGERADSSVLVNKEKKCVVEGIFQAEQ